MPLNLGQRAAACLVIGALLGACQVVEGQADSGDTGSDRGPEIDAIDAGDDRFAFEVTPSQEAAGRLAGAWGQLHVVSHLSNFPGYNAVATVTTMWQLVTMEAQGSGLLAVTETMCAVIVETPDMPVDTIIPDAFKTHLLPMMRRSAAAGTAAGSAFESDVMTDVRGCRLADPTAETLCFAPDDERSIDQDQDGHPGMTLNFTGAINAEVCIAQRWTSRFWGATLKDADRISGYVLSTSEQQILEASNPVLDGPDPDPAELGSWPDPDPERSYFEMVRLAPSATCDDVMRLGLTPRPYR